jgi:hypothetical protein
MSEKNPTLQDVWRLLGTMNKRVGERFDALERQQVQLREDLGGRISSLETRFGALELRMTAGFGALKESIEARDFRIDEHGRRLNDLERSAP